MALLALALAFVLSAQAPEKVDYARDIQPLLRANCYSCHGPALQNGGLRLDRRRDPMPNRVGANGARIVPGSSTTSRLYLRVAGNQAGTQMPPTGALTPAEIGLIKTWIDQGADWPDEFAGDKPSPPQNPQSVQLMGALRRGDRGSFEKLLAASPTAARSKGSGGTSPLMYAALYGDANSLRLLLDKGADPNARNDAGATALMWAVDDPEKTRVLLDRGADANARSDDSRTPLLLATARSGASNVVTLLLGHGAKLEGQPVLSRAAATGDEMLMRLLIRRGAELKPLPDDLAMRSGCAGCVELLLTSAERADLNRALTQAARFGNSAGIRMLLDRGAEPTSVTLGTAAASEKIPLEGVTALLDRGARSETAVDLALRLGETPVVDALRKAGGKETPVPLPDLKRPTAPRSVRAAVEKSVPLLQHADVVFLKKGGCVSCHNNTLFLMTAATARKKGFRVDEPTVQAQLRDTAVYLESWRERYLQDISIPGGLDTTGYILAGLASVSYPPDAATDSMARFLMRRQVSDGGWRIGTQRPPIESSDIEATALALRSLLIYAPRPQKSEYAKVIQRGTTWLTLAQPKSTEDHVFQLLGLSWASQNKAALRKAARDLIALQKPDGGWSQVPTLPSDAYATGQALTALAESGVIAVTERVYQDGVRFLLKTQLEDGTWYVRSRANPVQPYFDSEFPHGTDQFISAAATNWATIALMHAL
jgi:ankyrin repeat protein